MTRIALTLTAAALAATASVATASTSYFSVDRQVEANSYIELETVRSATDATVEIRDFRLGETGTLLGSIDVHEGANSNLKINLGTRPLGDVVAVLVDGGRVLATQRIEIQD